MNSHQTFKEGVKVWNIWRRKHPEIQPDLSDADFTGVILSEANLCEVNLSNAILTECNLIDADLTNSNLSKANLWGARLWGSHLNRADLTKAILLRADLSGADLSEVHLDDANLSQVNLTETNLSAAHLSGANLSGAILVGTNLSRATLTGGSIYGISAWNVQLEGAKQDNLVITQKGEPTITVDNLEVAQFIYLLLNNPKIRDVIDTVARKAVLILGRFSNERQMVLNALRDELRGQNYTSVVFNFEGNDSKSFAATVRTLANMAHFVLIDLTDLDETIREIADDIVPRCVVPIRPLLLQGSHRQGYEVFRELQHKYRWVLAPYRYRNPPDLQTGFQEKILQPIHEKIVELQQKKPLKVFIGYAPEDKNTLNTLKTHLRPLGRAGLIEVWDDQAVAPGEEKGKEVDRQPSDARIILLLISPNFIASDGCQAIQQRALERYEQGGARVVPVIIRPCAWQSTPIKDFQPLPKDGKPISRHKKDEIFFEVSEDIGEVIKSLG